MYMKTPALKLRFGFTLVELMVVVSVIGILSAIVYSSFGDSRKIARDNIRKTDLKNLQVAIELYKAQSGRYPYACGDSTSFRGAVNGGWTCGPGVTEYIKGLVPDFIAVLPVDPLASTYGATSNNGYVYRVNSSGTEYKLMSYQAVENVVVADCDNEYARYPRGNSNCTDPLATLVAKTYVVYKGSTAAGW
jgi:prepilin-type N-terminal cleavage/methylation domain-containing protein